MMTTRTSRFRMTALSIALLGTGLAAGLLIPDAGTTTSAFAQADVHRPATDLHTDHAQRTAELRKTMSGPVDIFFDVTEVMTSKPSLKGVRFKGLVDVTGKELLLFSKSQGEEWLIDPDMVLTFRLTPEDQRPKR